MSENTSSEVNIQSDRGTDSLGKSAYHAATDGKFDSKGFRASVTVMLGLVFLVFGAMLFTRKSVHMSKAGKEFALPNPTQNSPGINPKLLTERDLTNVIPHPKVESSFLGKIKVLSLRGTSSVPVGSEVRAVLVSGATDGIVKARLTSPMLVDGEPVLPERSILFGHGKSGDDRLFIEFTKVIFPSGEAYPILAQAFDADDRIQGLKGSIVGTRAKKMAGAMAFGFLGGMADGLQDTSGSYFTNHKTSLHDAALAGTSKAALDQSQAYLEEMKKSPNIIEVKAGTNIVVITDEPTRKAIYEEK